MLTFSWCLGLCHPWRCLCSIRPLIVPFLYLQEHCQMLLQIILDRLHSGPNFIAHIVVLLQQRPDHLDFLLDAHSRRTRLFVRQEKQEIALFAVHGFFVRSPGVGGVQRHALDCVLVFLFFFVDHFRYGREVAVQLWRQALTSSSSHLVHDHQV